MVPFWKEALEMVLDVEPEEDSSKIPDVSIVENSAELLYGLVHQRFILTKAGLQLMVSISLTDAPDLTLTSAGGEVRARAFWGMPKSVLSQRPCSSMRTCGYARCRHGQAVLP